MGPRSHHILIVDDDDTLRSYCQMILRAEGEECDEAVDGVAALEALSGQAYDLVVMDCDMPRMSGLEVVQQLRQAPPCPNLKIILVSGEVPTDRLAQQMLAGVDDFLGKPFSVVQLQARVRAALSLKDAQDRSDALVSQLLASNHDLEQALGARDSDLIQARNAIVLALAKLAEYRDTETGAHLQRLARYCRVLAEEAARSSVYAERIDNNFIEMLICCAPLHDIGKVGVPDDILLKPGKLTAEERLIMQTHTTIGAETLLTVARQHCFATVMLNMAATVARHHHERFDGTGYPDRLKGADIPLAARLVAIADVYDALRSRRPYKPGLTHEQTLELMLPQFSTQFDPALLHAFRNCAPQLASIFADQAD
jgi:response regulator RpfG family c-di-GMP phosphodiesterase